MSGFYKDIVAVLQSHGFLLVRQGKGSHEICQNKTSILILRQSVFRVYCKWVDAKNNYHQLAWGEGISILSLIHDRQTALFLTFSEM